MIIIRIIIILALVWLTLMALGWVAKWWIFKKLKTPNGQRTHKTKNIEAQALIKCKHCGTYIVKENAILKKNNAYCSIEHSRE